MGSWKSKRNSGISRHDEHTFSSPVSDRDWKIPRTHQNKNHYLILELRDHMPRWHTLGIPEKDSDMRRPPWAWGYRDMTSMHSHCQLATGNGKYQELTKKRILYFMMYLNCVMTSWGDMLLAFLKKTEKWDVRRELEYAFSSTVSNREWQHNTTKLVVVHDRWHMVTCLWAFNAITWVCST